MPNNFCKNIVIVLIRDLTTEELKIDNIFTSYKAAKYYRRRKYGLKAVRMNLSLNFLYPIEKWRVWNQTEVYENKVK